MQKQKRKIKKFKMSSCVICPYCRSHQETCLPLYFLPNVNCEIGINLKGYTSRSAQSHRCDFWKSGGGVCTSLSTYDLLCPNVNEVGPHMEGADEAKKQELFAYVVASVYPQNTSEPLRYCWTHMHIKWREMFRQMKRNYKDYVKEYKRKMKKNDFSPILFPSPVETRRTLSSLSAVGR